MVWTPDRWNADDSMLAGVPPPLRLRIEANARRRPKCRSGSPRLPGADRRTCPAEHGTERPDTCRGPQDPGPRPVTDPLRRWSASAPQRSGTGLPPAPASDFRVLIMRPCPVLEPRSACYLLGGTASQSTHREAREAAASIPPRTEIAVPRDHGRSVEPQTVKEWQRRLTGVDAMPLSLSARGLMHGDISADLL